MDTIDLELVNRSDNLSTDQRILIYGIAQKDSSMATAWMIIRDLGIGARHRFSLPAASGVAARDPFGNITARQFAQPITNGMGNQFTMFRDASGDNLVLTSQNASEFQAEVINTLPSGSIDALLFKAGQLFAAQSSIPPNGQAGFLPVTQLHFEVISGDLRTGARFEPDSGATVLDLGGLAKATIVLAGGGLGDPFTFTLEDTAES